MNVPKFKNINIKSYAGKSGVNKKKYIKLSANESSLGVSKGVKILKKKYIFTQISR